jgi:hypothetical protein
MKDLPPPDGTAPLIVDDRATALHLANSQKSVTRQKKNVADVLGRAAIALILAEGSAAAPDKPEAGGLA